MAMMMTGRVLLVCALCVLWCGVCGGERAETTPASPGNTSGKNPQSKGETVVGAGGGEQNVQQTAPQAPASKASGLPAAEADAVPSPSPAPQPRGEASVTASATIEKKDQNKEDKKNEEKKEEVEEEEERKKEEEREPVTGTTEGISAAGQEQPSLSSGAEGSSKITNPNSTQTTGDDDPAADVAGTAEGKQNENKESNAKETPVTATAMKTTTATTGDSDGSTAASHTTSPLLLLLLVVACAAAAAVVAA
ncbi:Mucin-associated surface protein (MASP) subgroup S068 [Trypanosoma cruzi]|uniref:Mucin-associated surface protein (MASP) subgroup S068 n=1 Tax=Trypanosoma cruzi TaxID=5693 RepID=A0A7J6Y2A1_TRYCR|nr:Mucin-associated surface protein (MASP) subgroup S068 [Trypanosoma cruzi]